MSRSVTGLVMEIDDRDSVRRVGVAIDHFAREISDFAPLWDDLEDLMESTVQRNFRTEGGNASRPWPALSDPYASRKRRLYGDRPKLVASGTLRRALTESSSSHALRHQQVDRFTYGTQDVPYASFHQTGTRKMPQRRPIDFRRSDMETRFSELLADHIRRAGRSAKLDVRRPSSGIRAGDVRPPDG